MIPLLILVIATSWFSACLDARRKQAQEAVRSYNDALILAYRTSDPTPVRDVATDKELRKLTVLIDLKRAANLVLESKLEKLAVTSVEEPNPGVMIVGTEERWRYFDRPLKPGAPPGQEFVARMRLDYTFVAVDGGWRMDQAKTVEHEYIQPQGYRHDPPRRQEISMQGEQS